MKKLDIYRHSQIYRNLHKIYLARWMIDQRALICLSWSERIWLPPLPPLPLVIMDVWSEVGESLGGGGGGGITEVNSVNLDNQCLQSMEEITVEADETMLLIFLPETSVTDEGEGGKQRSRRRTKIVNTSLFDWKLLGLEEEDRKTLMSLWWRWFLDARMSSFGIILPLPSSQAEEDDDGS